MLQTNLREPFTYNTVNEIAARVASASGIESLKERVTLAVREATRIHGNLPQRIGTWIHQSCMAIITNPNRPSFAILKEKVAEPIDLASLPVNQRDIHKS